MSADFINIKNVEGKLKNVKVSLKLKSEGREKSKVTKNFRLPAILILGVWNLACAHSRLPPTENKNRISHSPDAP